MRDRALVLIHGFSGSPVAWTQLRPHLDGAHDVLTPTLAGHLGGRPCPDPSMARLADELERDLDAAGLERAHLVGSSLGGWLALELGERGRALSVVALAPAGGWEAGSDDERNLHRELASTYARAKLAAPFARPLSWTGRLRRALLAQTTVHGERVTPAMCAQMIRDSAGCDAYLPLIAAIGEHGPPTFRRIACPVLLAWGELDRVLPAERFAGRYRAMLPHADWVVLPGVGHAPYYDDPAGVARLILDFVARVGT